MLFAALEKSTPLGVGGGLAALAQRLDAGFPNLQVQFTELLQFPGVLQSRGLDADALQREARQAAPSARPPHQDDAYAIALDPTRGTREDHAHSDQPGVATDVTTDDWHALMTEDTDPRAAAEPSAIADDWQADGTSVDTVHAPEPQQPEPARSAHETRPRGEPDRHANG